MSIYAQVAIAFAGVALFARLASWLNSFRPPFYILAGILLGPFGLGWVQNKDVIGLFSEIGIVFLLFYLGFEFSLEKFLKNGTQFVVAGLIDFAVNGIIGFAIGRLLGLSTYYSIVMAGIIYMSSSGIITKTLIELNVIKDTRGKLIMGIMVFEDLIMIIFLVIIASVANAETAVSWQAITMDIIKASIFCGALVFTGLHFNSLFSRVTNTESEEEQLLSFLAVVLIMSAIGLRVGVSKALTAFFVGMAFAEVSVPTQVQRLSITFRDIFGSLFFFYFGMQFQLEGLSFAPWVIILSFALAVIGKLLSSWLLARQLNCSSKFGLFIGFVTTARGEFSLLIASLVGANKYGLSTYAVLLVIFTSLVSTVAFRFGKNYLTNLPKVC